MSLTRATGVPLQDAFGRRFEYLRLSITDACGFRCVYCLPNGYHRPENAPEELTLAEIRRLVRAFSDLGTWKIRLTGGEPTVRRDLLEVVRTVAGVAGIRRVALSTHGQNLLRLARPLREAGVQALNVSVDSLDAVKFAQVTGKDALPDVLAGIDEAFAAGFESIKVNAVLMKGVNDSDLPAFLAFARSRPVTIRFIELMPTGQNRALFEARHARAESLRAELEAQGWAARARVAGDGPAVEYEHPAYAGRIGIIAPYSKDFCASCNRLRVSSRGGLRLCLFGESDSPLRHLLAHDDQREELGLHIRALLARKEPTHYLPEGRYGINHTFSAIGG